MIRMIRLPIFTLAACLPALAAAQGFDGAYISAETLGYSSDSDFGQITYSGGAQVSFGPGIAVSGDFTSYGFEALGGDATSGTLHGLYALNPITAVGAFYGFDSYANSDTSFYGAEGQTSFAGATVEAFLGRAEGDIAEGAFYGLSGQLVFGMFGVSADFARLDDTIATDRLSLAGEWHMGLGPTIYAEWGSVSGAIDEDYLAFGVRIGIGPNGGTTFGPRSTFEIAPGF
jgi:hypothetical protein